MRCNPEGIDEFRSARFTGRRYPSGLEALRSPCSIQANIVGALDRNHQHLFTQLRKAAMKPARFDPFSGASGDMMLGALLDAGLELPVLQEQLSLLPIGGYTIQAEPVEQHAVRGTRATVTVTEPQPARTWVEIREIIRTSRLSDVVRERALAIFERLAVAESQAHGVPVETVHFHEVGAVDAIVDICGAVIGIEAIGLGPITFGPVRTGAGFVRAQHGLMPVPAPATAAILASSGASMLPMPSGFESLEAELLTPTGAAILTTVATYDQQPFAPSRIAHGFGSRELPWPNALRLWIGESEPTLEEGTGPGSTTVVLETNIDDMNPQGYELLMERLFAAGALDVWLTPVQMKKSRPGTVLSVLCAKREQPRLEEVIFDNSPTLGIRSYPVERAMLEREFFTVATRFGDIRLKLAIRDGRISQARPEYDDCAELARSTGRPLSDVWDDAYRIGESLIGRDPATLSVS